MTLKEKFASIDQGKLKSEQVAFLQKIKTATKDFTVEDASVNEKVEGALDKMIASFKQSNPEAIIEKKMPVEEKPTVEKKPTVAKNRDNQTVIINQVGWAGINLGRIDIDIEKGLFECNCLEVK